MIRTILKIVRDTLGLLTIIALIIGMYIISH